MGFLDDARDVKGRTVLLIGNYSVREGGNG
jgi:hypothetical protein